MRLLRAPGSWVLLALLATLAWADSASAQGLALGPFRVLPSLEFSIEYDDNILLTKDDKLDDIIFHIIPGVSLELHGIPAERAFGRRCRVLPAGSAARR